jgi:hypothetical protein
VRGPHIHHRLAFASAIALAALGLGAAQAGAAKLERDGAEMTYTGAADASDGPFISVNSITGDYEFSTDRGFSDPLPTGCGYITTTWVKCPAGFTHLTVKLGDQADGVLAPDVRVPMTINAGGGDDSVTGGQAADEINGEEGQDTLVGDGVWGGANSHDEIDGGAGDDTLRGDVYARGHDVLRGGAGTDTAWYGDRPASEPVSLSLDGAADDGAAGEGDDIAGDVEKVVGGWGDDTLTGDDAANILDGGEGRDTLTGGGGLDVLLGGPGDDDLRARDGLAEDPNCGDGTDAATIDLSDRQSNCEAVDASGILQVDADGDGLDDPADCNDLDAGIRPGRTDVPENGVDEDCGGGDAVNYDRDGDGIARPQDCDDGDARIHPGAVEVLDNGIDEDCLGGDSVNRDRDADGYPRPADCNDANAAIHPGAKERRGNRVDEDCAGGPQPYLRVRAEIVVRWDIYTDHTRLRALAIRGMEGRGRAVVLCHGGGCPYERRTVGVRKGRAQLEAGFRGRHLAPGTVVEVRALRTGMTGKVVRYRMRKAKPPRVQRLCLDPGKRRPGAC